jgi:hypothetical protein
MIDIGTLCQTLPQENAVSGKIIPILPYMIERDDKAREHAYPLMWDAYRSGQMSTSQLTRHWRDDPVFEAYCVQRDMREKREG